MCRISLLESPKAPRALLRQMARMHCKDLCIIRAHAGSVKMAFGVNEWVSESVNGWVNGKEAGHARKRDIATNSG